MASTEIKSINNIPLCDTTARQALSNLTFKTINGESILGYGDLELVIWHVDSAAPTSDIGNDGDLFFQI